MRWDHVTSNFHAMHMDGWMASLTCSPRRWIRLSCPSPFPRDSGSTGFLQCSFQQSIEALSTETDTKGYIGVTVKYRVRSWVINLSSQSTACFRAFLPSTPVQITETISRVLTTACFLLHMAATAPCNLTWWCTTEGGCKSYTENCPYEHINLRKHIIQ